MNALMDLSNALAATVETAGQGVVRVEARRRLPASGIVWSSDGIVVTAHHVVRREEDIFVGLAGGEKVPATLVGRDATTDLAVLRCEAKGITPPAWAAGDDLRVGHLVLALGRPGESVMATLGIVSALGESWRTPTGGQIDRYLQTDVVMYPGFSGGLLINTKGEGIGLDTSALLRGISLTVPYNTLHQVTSTLLEHGRVRRGYLGVGVQPARLPIRLAEKLGQETGVLLVSVEPGSPADLGGLLLGDVMVALDGQPVRQLDDLMAVLRGVQVGVDVSVRVVRGGQVKDLNIRLGEHE